MRQNLLSLSLVLGIVVGAIFIKNHLENIPHTTRNPASLKEIQSSFQAQSLKKYAFGFDNLLASLLWIRFLQRHDHTALNQDSVSWEYAELDAITTLDPGFAPGYRFGSLFLSVLRRDKMGGKLLLEKWAKREPLHYLPQQMLGMHYYEELGDYERATPHILRASQMKDAPFWLSSLGIRFLSETGSKLNAIETALELARTTHREEERTLLMKRISALRSTQDRKLASELYQTGIYVSPTATPRKPSKGKTP